MRKFFSFRSSSAATNESIKNSPDSNGETGHWKNPLQNDVEDATADNEGTLRDSAGSCHRRSRSVSSSAVYSDSREGHLNSSRNASGSPSSHSNGSRRSGKYKTVSHSSTPKWLLKSRMDDLPNIRKTLESQKFNASNHLIRDCSRSPRQSPCSSPIPLRCRTSRVTKISNNNSFLDRYIVGEQEERKSNNQQLSSTFENDSCLAETRLLNNRRPPRSHSTAPTSPIHSSENMRSYSFGEMRDIHHLPGIQSWVYLTDELRAASPGNYRKKTVNSVSHAHPIRSKMSSWDNNSKTTTTAEDIYEDNPYSQPASLSDAQKCSLFDHPHSFASGSSNSDSMEDVPGSQRQNCFLGVGTRGVRHEFSTNVEDHGEDKDRGLLMKLKETEERLMLQSGIDREPEILLKGNLCIPALLETIKDINADRRNSVLELLAQIECRIAERSSAKETLNQAKIDLDTRARRLEKEKNELQINLETELERRSCDWSIKLEKFQSEEQRLRERVRELAEQNVNLQRKVSSLSIGEQESRSMNMNLETQLNDLTARLEEVNSENQNLRQNSMELESRSHSAETDLDCIKRTYKEKEKEIREFQKAIVRLQKTCNEQEKTIAGLRQGYSDEIGKRSLDREDIISRLQLEQIRLTDVEQMLRRELETCKCEVESLRHENICLLDRLQSNKGGCGGSMFRLEQELCARVEYLENMGFVLLDDYNELCGELLEFSKCKQFKREQEINGEPEGYTVFEFNAKHRSLKEATANMKRSLLSVSVALDEKCNLGRLGYETSLQELAKKVSEDDLEVELEAERLLSRVLREKMCSKKLELEQLQGRMASLVRGGEISRVEIERLKDEVSSLSHKANDMELQMLKKDENFNHLERDLKECKQECIASRSILPKVSEERDRLWEEVKTLKENNMLLTYEVNSLKKKIDALEEDILIKEGQITILKDSVGNKHLDLLCSPKSLTEYIFE